MAQGKIRLSELSPFQGKLKKRTEAEISELMLSLKTEGMMMPFAVWQGGGKNYLLDGHGRYEALKRLALFEPDINGEEFPCIFIEAETEDDARKALLQILSSYGKITRVGVRKFTATIPDYRAPSINRFVADVKKSSVKAIDKHLDVPANDTIRIRVKTGYRDDKGNLLTKEKVLELFKKFEFLEILK